MTARRDYGITGIVKCKHEIRKGLCSDEECTSPPKKRVNIETSTLITFQGDNFRAAAQIEFKLADAHVYVKDKRRGWLLVCVDVIERDEIL